MSCVLFYMLRALVLASLLALTAACEAPPAELPVGHAIAVSELGGGPVYPAQGTPIIASLSYPDVIASAVAAHPRCQQEVKQPWCLPPYPGTAIPPAPVQSLYLALPFQPYCYEHREYDGIKGHNLTFVYWIGAMNCRTLFAAPTAGFRLIAVPLKLLPSGTLTVRVKYQAQTKAGWVEPPAAQVAIP